MTNINYMKNKIMTMGTSEFSLYNIQESDLGYKTTDGKIFKTYHDAAVYEMWWLEQEYIPVLFNGVLSKDVGVNVLSDQEMIAAGFKKEKDYWVMRTSVSDAVSFSIKIPIDNNLSTIDIIEQSVYLTRAHLGLDNNFIFDSHRTTQQLVSKINDKALNIIKFLHKKNILVKHKFGSAY